jgi:hypothetical protein
MTASLLKRLMTYSAYAKGLLSVFAGAFCASPRAAASPPPRTAAVHTERRLLLPQRRVQQRTDLSKNSASWKPGGMAFHRRPDRPAHRPTRLASTNDKSPINVLPTISVSRPAVLSLADSVKPARDRLVA